MKAEEIAAAAVERCEVARSLVQRVTEPQEGRLETWALAHGDCGELEAHLRQRIKTLEGLLRESKEIDFHHESCNCVNSWGRKEVACDCYLSRIAAALSGEPARQRGEERVSEPSEAAQPAQEPGPTHGYGSLDTAGGGSR